MLDAQTLCSTKYTAIRAAREFHVEPNGGEVFHLDQSRMQGRALLALLQ
jgi:hypothetical protein